MIDPKILSVLWGELPSVSQENYKLKFHRGEAVAQEVSATNEDTLGDTPQAPEAKGASMAVSAIASKMRSTFEDDEQEQLE